jgi:coenzyme F420-reducing hydrogenase beta subunit
MVVSDERGVESGAGSAYYPVELSGVLGGVLEMPGRYAITGLPCFIRAVRHGQLYNKKLAERIVVTVGLVCGGGKNRFYTDRVARHAGVGGRVVSARFRCKNPGVGRADDYYYAFKDEFGCEKRVSWNEGGVNKFWRDPRYTPAACHHCADVFAECADITLMDAWLPEYMDETRGTSLIITRSKQLNDIIVNSIRDGQLVLKEVPVEKIVESQLGLIKTRRARRGPLSGLLWFLGG